MKTLQVELPDQLVREIEQAVAAGSFANNAEVIQAALRDFISNRRFQLVEQQQMNDIEWALQGRAKEK